MTLKFWSGSLEHTPAVSAREVPWASGILAPPSIAIPTRPALQAHPRISPTPLWMECYAGDS